MKHKIELSPRKAQLVRIALTRAIRDTEALIDAHMSYGKVMKGYAAEVRGWRAELKGFHGLAAEFRFGAPPPRDPLAGCESVPVTEIMKLYRRTFGG